PEDAVYLGELEQLQRRIPGLRFVATMTRMAESARSWSGPVERLSAEFLESHLLSVVGPAYFIAGAPFFISQLRTTLLGAGVADRDIGIEMHGGYCRGWTRTWTPRGPGRGRRAAPPPHLAGSWSAAVL